MLGRTHAWRGQSTLLRKNHGSQHLVPARDLPSSPASPSSIPGVLPTVVVHRGETNHLHLQVN